MNSKTGVRYVTEDDIRAMRLGPAACEQAVRWAYGERRAGRVRLVPKFGTQEPDGAFAHAMPVRVGELAVLKWVVSGDGSPGSRYINATLVASHGRTGATLAVMEAEELTALRTAAVTGLALRLMPDPRRQVASFIGCGLQARVHADVLIEQGVTRFLAYSRRRSTAEQFAQEMQARGASTRVVETAREAVEGADVVVSAVPLSSGIARFLDPAWARPHAFIASIDLGKPWIARGQDRFAKVLTDDRAHTTGLMGGGHLAYQGRIDADLSDLLGESGAMPAGPVYMVAPGNALSDAAMARLVLDRLASASAGKAA